MSCSILHKDIVKIDGFKGKRITYGGSILNYSFYQDEYTFATENYTILIQFTTDNKSFIDSNDENNIINSLKINDNKFIPFKDVNKSEWYYNAVSYTYLNGLIAGYNSSTFAPNDKLTRAMIVTILYRMENSPSNNGNSNFSDVESNVWYSKAIKWAADCGIVHGYEGTGRFGPNDFVTREQLATMLYNYPALSKKDMSEVKIKTNILRGPYVKKAYRPDDQDL